MNYKNKKILSLVSACIAVALIIAMNVTVLFGVTLIDSDKSESGILALIAIIIAVPFLIALTALTAAVLVFAAITFAAKDPKKSAKYAKVQIILSAICSALLLVTDAAILITVLMSAPLIAVTLSANVLWFVYIALAASYLKTAEQTAKNESVNKEFGFGND